MLANLHKNQRQSDIEDQFRASTEIYTFGSRQICGQLPEVISKMPHIYFQTEMNDDICAGLSQIHFG